MAEGGEPEVRVQGTDRRLATVAREVAPQPCEARWPRMVPAPPEAGGRVGVPVPERACRGLVVAREQSRRRVAAPPGRRRPARRTRASACASCHQASPARRCSVPSTDGTRWNRGLKVNVDHCLRGVIPSRGFSFAGSRSSLSEGRRSVLEELHEERRGSGGTSVGRAGPRGTALGRGVPARPSTSAQLPVVVAVCAVNPSHSKPFDPGR